jgi:hypothetical protein
MAKDRPLRATREIANGALSDLSADFEAMYMSCPVPRKATTPSTAC